MKHLSKLLLCIPLLALLMQSSCKKNKDALKNDGPKITSYGSYKFAARVNGQDFIPRGDILNPPIDVQKLVSSTPGKFNYYIMAYNNNESSLEIYVDDFKGIGTYSLNVYTIGYPQITEPPSCGMYRLNSSTQPLWITNSIENGSITFSEYSNGKVKCFFSFKAKNLLNTNIIEVTDGYFSIN